MRSDLTDITFVMDRSGSMQHICEDIIGGVNAFLERQRKLPGECLVTYTQFDDVYEVIYTALPIRVVPDLNKETYVPRNSTALFDAIGRAIQSTGARLAAMPAADRPEDVIFVIVTDGKNNASREFDRDRIFDMIKLQRDTYSWKFIFLAANQDAFQTGSSYGMHHGHTMTYGASPQGVSKGFAAASILAAKIRSKHANTSFTEQDRKDAGA